MKAVNIPMAALLIAVLPLVILAHSRDLDGRYTNSPDKPWFEAQVSPKTGVLCCSVADGNEAQEDIRNGQYWTQWLSFPWTPVPWDVVLRGPNPRGHPIVWWSNNNGLLEIRCYSPGGGV